MRRFAEKVWHIRKSITFQMTRCGLLLRQMTAKRMRHSDTGLTPEEATLLNQLWDQDCQTLSELGHWALKGASTVTRQVDSLEKKGFIAREHGTQDRRNVYVRLTAKGRGIEREFRHDIGLSMLDTAIPGISPAELATTLSVIKRVRDFAAAELNE